jgi:hypothetical protein
MTGNHGGDGWIARAVAESLAMDSEARAMYAQAREAIQSARRMRESLSSQLQQMSREDPSFYRRFRQSMLLAVVDAAIRVAGADMGNIQLFEPASKVLRIQAQRGFSQPFLGFFDCVDHGVAPCGVAFKLRSPVTVDEVEKSRIFLGTPALEVVLDAGVRAVQSTPLITPSGRTLGVVSTHWRRPWRPRDTELRLLDLVARSAADWVEHRMHLEPSPDGEWSG